MSNDRFSIAGIVRRWAAQTPHAPCLTYEGCTRTWAEVFDRSRRVAAGLSRAGVAPQDRVAFLDKNGPSFFELAFGASMVGAVSQGLNWRLAPAEMRQILDHSHTKVLVIGREFLGHLAQFEAELATVEKIVVLGGGHRVHDDYEEWLATHHPHDPKVPIDDDDTVAQTYTSGTTGLPKAAMFRNAAIHATLAVADDIGIRNESVVMVAMPLFHAVGSTWGMFSLAFGCHCVIMRDVVPARVLDAIERFQVTKVMLVPAVLQMLLAEPEFERRTLTSLETIVYASSPISPHLLKQCLDAFRCDFLQLYGLTETNSATILSPSDHTDALHPERLSSAGCAVRGAVVRVVDPSTGQDKPEGEVGEVWVKAPTNTHGYWADPTESAATITADGFVRTGDGGSLEGGYLYIRDRLKDMIVTGGENVYPAEVENVLITHPAIADVAVIGVPSERWGETVKAVVVAARGSTPGVDEIIAFTKERLAGYKCPTSVDFLDELPRNPSGKILKRELRKVYWDGHVRQVS